MPRVTKSTARKDLYLRGLRTKSDKTNNGWLFDKSKPADENDTIQIKKGETYYSWALFRSPKQYSLTYPKRQRLTQSGFLISLFDLEDNQSEMSADDNLADNIDSFIQEVETLRDETQESLDNMPEHLQECSSFHKDDNWTLTEVTKRVD